MDRRIETLQDELRSLVAELLEHERNAAKADAERWETAHREFVEKQRELAQLLAPGKKGH